MDRDRRLTGYLRGQTDNPVAPAGFELNNPWRVCSSLQAIYKNVMLTILNSSRSGFYRFAGVTESKCTYVRRTNEWDAELIPEAPSVGLHGKCSQLSI
jgi:hypothetical protein